MTGYAPYESEGNDDIIAGSDIGKSITLVEESLQPLALVSDVPPQCEGSTTSNSGTPAAVVELTFNQPIELVTDNSAGKMTAEAIDDGVSTTPYLTFNSDTSETVSERGTAVVVPEENNTVLRISWTPANGLGGSDAGSTNISGVTYSVSNAYVQPKGHPSGKRSLASLLSAESSYTTSISCL